MKKSSTVRVSPGLFPPGPNSATPSHTSSSTSSLYLPGTLDKPRPLVNLFVEEPPAKLFPPSACLYVNDAPITLYPPESLEQAKEHAPVVTEEMPKLYPPGSSGHINESAVLHQPHKMKGAFHQFQSQLCQTKQTLNSNGFVAMANRSWFYGNEIASIYGFPKPDPARNVTIGVISFGGGLYGDVAHNGLHTKGDVQAYWTKCGIPEQQQPRVFVIPLFGAKNTVADSGTDENTLDVEMVGCACPSPNLTIILYLVPNSLSNFQTAVQFIITNPVGGNPLPNILSVSWAASEIYNYGELEATLKSAADRGINIFVASGDYGSTDTSGNTSTCNYPSSSPSVISCGGTNLVCPSLKYDSTTRETTWTGSGGGISKIYPKPSYQSSLTGNFRQIPDISLDADPSTGIAVLLNGEYFVFGGTSFVAPLMAGFLATINVSKFINPLLYSAPRSCFYDIISGNNGTYSAKAGYDACTGLGSINGANLSQWLTNTNVTHVTGISVSPSTVSLPVQRTTQLAVSVLPSNATNTGVTWTSSNPSVCSVTNSGLVTSLSSGDSVITATTDDGGFKATSQITVPEQTLSVSSISISPSTIKLLVNQTYQINPVIAPMNAANKAVTWSSSIAAVATVSPSGLVTVRQNGTTVITATTVDGRKTASLTVTATVSVSTVSITPSAINLQVNKTYQAGAMVMPSNATNKQVTWSSSKADVASVSSSGLVTAKQGGTAVVKATTIEGGKSAFLTVSVYNPVISVNITPVIVNLSVNQKYQINYTIAPENAGNKEVIWSSSKDDIASVSPSGVVTANSSGTCVVSVKTVDGNKISACTIRVNSASPVLKKNIMPIALNQSTKAGQMSYMKVTDPDIDLSLVVKSFMKYKND
jgi:uncharacterized protein YjdB